MKPLFAALALLPFLLAAATVRANDGVGELGLGGIVAYGKTDAVALRREVLRLGWQAIDVEYEFVNGGPAAVRLPVVFPLPEYEAAVPTAVWMGQPAGFSLEVDGAPAPFTTRITARRVASTPQGKREDVTAALRAAGLTDEQITRFPVATPFPDGLTRTLRVQPLSAAQVARLTREGLLGEGPFDGPYPQWTVQVVYAWQLEFPAGKVTRVRHHYAPFADDGAHSYYLREDEIRSDFCADDAFVGAWRKVSAAVDPADGTYRFARGSIVEYILTTANTWRGPIGEFVLQVRKSQPGELVALCYPGVLREVDARTLEWRATAFVPTQEIRVLFSNRATGGIYPEHAEPPRIDRPAR